MDDESMSDYLNMTEWEQIQRIESVMISLWDEGIIELVGFDEHNQPLFRRCDFNGQ